MKCSEFSCGDKMATDNRYDATIVRLAGRFEVYTANNHLLGNWFVLNSFRVMGLKKRKSKLPG